MHIDIWMDITCPFCYIGTTQLDQALQIFEHKEEVTVIHHSFQLDSSAPRETKETLNEMLARRKNISLEEADQLNNHVVSYAASMGLTFHLEKAIPVNSFDAHRLTYIASKNGKQSEMIRLLFAAYFEHGENIASEETLVRLGTEIGLDADSTRTSLKDNEHADDVRKDISQASQYGIHGVPFFIIDNKYTISGAQGVDAFTATLEKIREETQ